MTSEKPAELPKVPPDHLKNFSALVEYLGLSEKIVVTADEPNEVVPIEIVPSEKFNLHGSKITLEEEGKVAVHSPNCGYEYVLGENVYQRGIVHLKLKLEAFRNDGQIFVGIVKEDGVRQNNCIPQSWYGSYGWALGWTGRVWKKGSCTIDYALQNLTKQERRLS